MSWLSHTFHEVTGTNLSNVVGPALAIAGTAVGLPVIGGIAGGLLSGGGDGGQQTAAPNAGTPNTGAAGQNNNAGGATTKGTQTTDAERAAMLQAELDKSKDTTSKYLVFGAVGIVGVIALIALFKR